ncbi:MAG: tetratricopeptide repeat protein [Nitrospirae bacterium]|nr:tetratricopeptide repeat protein [Nitrospirota bacterium]
MELQGQTKFIWVVPVLLCLLVNQNVLQNGFGWDDENIIRGLRPLDRWSDLVPNFFTKDTPKESSPYFRPFVSVSYVVDNIIWGRKPFGYHFSVWSAHIVNTALVFFLAKALMPNMIGVLKYAPLLTASLFAVHPAHAEAVAWIAGRNDVFCTTFMLLSILLYIQYHRSRNGMAFVASMLTFFLALLTKETAVGIVILFPLYEYLQGSIGPDSIARRICLRWSVPIILLIVYFWMRKVNIEYPYGHMSSTAQSHDRIGQWISHGVGALGSYLELMIFPYPHRPFIANIPTSITFLFPAALGGILFLGGSFFWSFYRHAVLGFGSAWTLVTLAPAVTAAMFGFTTTPLAERYIYGPSVGFLMVEAWLILGGLERLNQATAWPPPRVWTVAGFLLVVLMSIWGWESWSRNSVWHSPLTFWQTTVATAPEVGYPYRALGVQYAQKGDLAQAEKYYRQAIEVDDKALHPDPLEVAYNLNNLAVLYNSQGRYAEAEAISLRSLAIWEEMLGSDHPNVAMDLYNLGVIYREQKHYDKAVAFFQRALAIDEKEMGRGHTSVAETLDNLALIYGALGRYTEAEPLYQRALEIWEQSLGPTHLNVATDLEHYAALLRKMKRSAEAEKMEARAADIRNKQVREHQ